MKTIRAVARAMIGDESGQALAEFALIMPLLFLLIAGIIGFGRAWNIQQVVVDAAREGARVAVVQNPATSDSTTGVAAVRTTIKRRLAAAVLDTTAVTITITGKWRSTNDPMEVFVNMPYSLPLLSVLMNWATGTPNFQIKSKTTMRNE